LEPKIKIRAQAADPALVPKLCGLPTCENRSGFAQYVLSLCIGLAVLAFSTGIQYWHSVLAFGIVAHSFVDQQKRIGKAECRKSPEVGHQACLARFPIG